MIAYLAFALVRIFLILVQALPLGLLLKFGRALGALAWIADRKHRRVAVRNVEISGLGSAEVARESFIRFFQNALGAAWIAGRKDEDLKGVIAVHGIRENLLPAAAEGRGVIHVMFHFGNWEAMARVVGRIPELKFSTIYQPLRNRRFNEMIAGWRKRSGVELINRHDGFKGAIAKLRRGEAVGMLVDQHAGDHGMWIPFFGRLASTTTLPALLARRTGAKIVPIFCWNAENFRGRDAGPAQWIVQFAPAIPIEGKSDGAIMSEIHSRLERAIEKDPPNWFWLHERWKTPSPNFLLHGYRRGIYVPSHTTLKPFRILVRTSNWLGDAIISIPGLRAIKAGRPDCHLTVLTPPKLKELWQEQSWIDDVVTSIEEARGNGIGGGKCDACNFEAAILFPNSLRSAIEAWKLGIPRRQGFAGHFRRWLLTAVCPESLRGGLHQHDVQDFCALAHWSGACVENEIPILDLKSHAHGKSDYVVLHPGAAFGSAKRWLPERFVELVRKFPNVNWRIIGSAEEAPRNREMLPQMGGNVEDMTGKLNLVELGQMLSSARAVVCNDSGPMHLAAAVGAPIVAIFGSTEPLHTGPLGAKVRVVRKHVECSPCYLRECPIDLRCMKAVSVEDVAQALRSLLE